LTGQSDLDRLRLEYQRRAADQKKSDLYSLSNPAHLYLTQQRQRAELSLLHRYGFYPLDGRRVLDIGCGSGRVLYEYFGYAGHPRAFFGLDLLPDRVSAANRRLPFLGFSCADGQSLPFPGASFDLVVQHMLFSSVLDPAVRKNIAAEMARVLNKERGMLVWYDFWTNPTNPHTRGIRPAEIRALFPGFRVDLRRVTLAPPIARRLAPVSWVLAAFLESLRIFNTHYLAAILPGE
jgi:ubiquinone/menaquinone biosynthesis C-methylase UbiE